MSETFVTLFGNIATDPKRVQTAGGLSITKFRLACTATRRDPATGAYADGVTSFYSVSCWRDLGTNTAASLLKGQAVVVHGKQVVREWTAEDGRKGIDVGVDALIVGHDLRFGQASFVKVRRGPAPVPAGDGEQVTGFGAAADEELSASVPAQGELVASAGRGAA